MTIEEKVKALMEGRRFRYGDVVFDYAPKSGRPFRLTFPDGETDHIKGFWNDEWTEITAEKPWQPEHEEKVLCRDQNCYSWDCGYYSHTKLHSHVMIGGNCFNEIAPFDKEKLGKVTE